MRILARVPWEHTKLREVSAKAHKQLKYVPLTFPFRHFWKRNLKIPHSHAPKAFGEYISEHCKNDSAGS
jgi:hypothetical protein